MWPHSRTGRYTENMCFTSSSTLPCWWLDHLKEQGGCCPTIWTTWTPAAAPPAPSHLFLLSDEEIWGSSYYFKITNFLYTWICLVTITYDPLQNSSQLSYHHTTASVGSPFTLTKCNPSAACSLASWADWPSGWRMWYSWIKLVASSTLE